MPANRRRGNPRDICVCVVPFVLYFSAVLRALKYAALLAAAASLTGCAAIGHLGSFSNVVVDAGHGGIDKGARARDGSAEKNYTLDTAKRLKKSLQGRGFNVVMTRSGDYFVPLPTRAAISNRQWNSVFVSVHYNDSPRSAPYGTETYYFSPRSYSLAAHIQQELAKVTHSRGVKRARFHVLRNNSKPAVLVELGFLSSPEELRRIRSGSYRSRLADAIARGVAKSQR